MTAYIGIDGGSTKTFLRMADSGGQILYEGTGGPTNIYSVSKEEAKQTVCQLISDALRAVKDDIQISAICIGAAGVIIKKDRDFFFDILQTHTGCENITVVNDGLIALYAFLEDRSGIVITAGTGSICYGKNDENDIVQVGGWGSLISDEGSGFAFARDSLSEAFRQYDGRSDEHSMLINLFMSAENVNSPEELLHVLCISPDKQKIASLFPLVETAAANGDAAARRILTNGIEELVFMCETAISRLNLAGKPFSLGMNGSVLTKSEWVRPRFIKSIKELYPFCVIQETGRDAAWGALYLAGIKIK